MTENIEDKLGQSISDVLMRVLKEAFPNELDPYKVYSSHEISFMQGQQSVIGYLEDLKSEWDDNILK